MGVTLKPGILVSLKTRKVGGVEYRRNDLDRRVTSDGAVVTEWETTKVVVDPEEDDRASRARESAGACIIKVCYHTDFGLLCPVSRKAELDAAYEKAQGIVRDFNATARNTRIFLRMMEGTIAASDETAAQRIADEVRELLREMESGIRRVDADAIRDAASRALQVGAMLDETETERIGAAVAVARSAAREITRRVTKGGEEAALVAQDLTAKASALELTRFSFLDLGDEAAAPAELLPSVDLQRFAELDEAPAATGTSDAAPYPARVLESV